VVREVLAEDYLRGALDILLDLGLGLFGERDADSFVLDVK